MKNPKGVEDGIGAKHFVLSVSSCGSPDPDLRSGTVRCICGKEYSFKGDGSLKAAWDSINAHVAAMEPSAPATTEVRGKASPEMEQLRASLRAAAGKSTPGPWQAVETQGVMNFPIIAIEECVSGKYLTVCEISNSMKAAKEIPADTIDANAAFISLASPENILKLLDHIEGKG